MIDGVERSQLSRDRLAEVQRALVNRGIPCSDHVKARASRLARRGLHLNLVRTIGRQLDPEERDISPRLSVGRRCDDFTARIQNLHLGVIQARLQRCDRALAARIDHDGYHLIGLAVECPIIDLAGLAD